MEAVFLLHQSRRDAHEPVVRGGRQMGKCLGAELGEEGGHQGQKGCHGAEPGRDCHGVVGPVVCWPGACWRVGAVE